MRNEMSDNPWQYFPGKKISHFTISERRKRVWRKCSVKLSFCRDLVHFTDLPPQLKRGNGKIKCETCNLRSAEKITLLFQKIMIPECSNDGMITSHSPVEAIPTINRKAALLVTPATVKMENSKHLKPPTRMTTFREKIHVQYWQTTASWRRTQAKTSSPYHWNSSAW